MLLFLQLAVSAYACNMVSLGGTNAASNAVQESPMECDGSMDAPSKLCEQHCLQGAQSADTQPQTAPLAPLLPLILVAGQWQTHLATVRENVHARLVIQVDPPPLVRFGVLRI